MTIIEHLREYFLIYPDLPAGDVGIDFLGAEPTQFTLEPVPCEPIFRKYTDGGCLRQFLFVFASRSYYGADVALCAENQALFEGLDRWLRDNEADGILPNLGEHRAAVSLEVRSSGYAFAEGADTARYQMQLRLIYQEI